MHLTCANLFVHAGLVITTTLDLEESVAFLTSCDSKCLPRQLIPLGKKAELFISHWFYYCRLSRYSFDYGSAHFIIMSTEHMFTPGSEQYRFIESQLSTVNRTITPWLIFGGHRLGIEKVKVYMYMCSSTRPPTAGSGLCASQKANVHSQQRHWISRRPQCSSIRS